MDAVIDDPISTDESLEIRPQSIRSKIASIIALIVISFLANIGGWLPGRTNITMQPLTNLAPWSQHEELRETVGGDHLLHEIAIIHHTAARLRALFDEPPVNEEYVESELSRRVISGPRVQWVSNQGLGRPGVAMPGFALLSPATWIHVILPPEWSWTVWGTLQLFIAGFGAWLLTGKYILAPGPRFIAAIIFMLCGLHVAWMHGSMSTATMWLPWCALATLRLAASPTLLRASTLTLLLALQLAAGSAPTSVGTIATCLILLCTEVAKPKFLPALLGFLLSLVVALLMTGLHWLPWWEYVSDVQSVPPSSWMVPISQQLTQAVTLTTAMFSITAIALAAIAVRRRWRDRNMRLWLVIFLALGACAWIVQMLAWTQPQWTWAIVLGDVGLLAGPAMALAILAAIGVDAMSSERRAISMWNPLVVAGGAAVLVLALLGTSAWLANGWPDRLVIASFARLIIAIVVAGAIVLLMRRGATLASLRMLTVAVTAELVVFAIIANWGSRVSDIFPTTPEIEYLQQQPAARIDGPRLAMPPNLASVYGLDDVRSAGNLAPTGAVVFGSTLDSDADRRVAFIDIRHRVGSDAPPSTQPGPSRAWVAQRARILPTRDEVLREIKTSSVNPAEPLIDQEIAPEIQRVLDDELARNPNWWKRETKQTSSAEYQRLSPEEIRVRVRGGGGWLIIADQYAPGWHAYVNGHEAPVVRAYGAFIAVAVPNGNIDVLLRYIPRSGQRGMYSSCGGVLALLMLVSLGMLPRFSE